MVTNERSEDRALGLSTLKRVFCSSLPRPKITKTLEDGIRRVKDYVMPHESERMKAATGGKMSTMLGKLLIFEREAPSLAGRSRSYSSGKLR